MSPGTPWLVLAALARAASVGAAESANRPPVRVGVAKVDITPAVPEEFQRKGTP